MTRFSIILLTALMAIAAINCGDNIKVTDDGGPADGGIPAAPALGLEIDRLGRPAINTVLNHGFDGSASAAGAAKDAYNQDGSPGGWMQYIPEFARNLAILDALDTGVSCVMGVCSASPGTNGCGDQVEYNGTITGGGSATVTSYGMLGGLLADDEMFLDTTKMLCDIPTNHQNYLAVEFNALTGLTNTCGGRAPTNDVIDTSYTALGAGLGGFAADFSVAFHDGVDPHTDVSNDAFPFLGAPH